MKHYHIQWDESKLDWQAFDTESEAETEAQRLKLPGEKFSIVSRDGDCPRCLEIKKRALG